MRHIWRTVDPIAVIALITANLVAVEASASLRVENLQGWALTVNNETIDVHQRWNDRVRDSMLPQIFTCGRIDGTHRARIADAVDDRVPPCYVEHAIAERSR